MKKHGDEEKTLSLNLDLLLLSQHLQKKKKTSPRHDGLRCRRSGRHLQVCRGDVLEQRGHAGGRGALEEEGKRREGCRESRRFFNKDGDGGGGDGGEPAFRRLLVCLSAELISSESPRKKEQCNKIPLKLGKSFFCVLFLQVNCFSISRFHSFARFPPHGSPPLPLPLPRRGAEPTPPPPRRDQCPGGGPLEAGAAVCDRGGRREAATSAAAASSPPPPSPPPLLLPLLPPPPPPPPPSPLAWRITAGEEPRSSGERRCC